MEISSAEKRQNALRVRTGTETRTESPKIKWWKQELSEVVKGNNFRHNNLETTFGRYLNEVYGVETIPEVEKNFPSPDGSGEKEKNEHNSFLIDNFGKWLEDNKIKLLKPKVKVKVTSTDRRKEKRKQDPDAKTKLKKQVVPKEDGNNLTDAKEKAVKIVEDFWSDPNVVVEYEMADDPKDNQLRFIKDKGNGKVLTLKVSSLSSLNFPIETTTKLQKIHPTTPKLLKDYFEIFKNLKINGISLAAENYRLRLPIDLTLTDEKIDEKTKGEMNMTLKRFKDVWEKEQDSINKINVKNEVIGDFHRIKSIEVVLKEGKKIAIPAIIFRGVINGVDLLESNQNGKKFEGFKIGVKKMPLTPSYPNSWGAELFKSISINDVPLAESVKVRMFTLASKRPNKRV